MSETLLAFSVRTPREVVLQRNVSSVRIPIQTGQLGIRPRTEPLVLAVEPGLVMMRRNGDYLFVGTAGGLLRSNGVNASLLTPLAVSGPDEEAVLEGLDQALAAPSIELEARATLGRLESSILRELREQKKATGGSVGSNT